MADIQAHVAALNAKRAKAHKELNDHFDSVIASGRTMNEEEKVVEARILADIEGLEDEIRRFVAHEEREAASAELRDAASAVFGAPAVANADRQLVQDFRTWALSGSKEDFEMHGFTEYVNIRSQMRDQGLSGRELRNALYTDTGSIGSAVPTTMAATLYEYIEASNAMFRAPTTKITTGSGESRDFPKVTAHAIGTQVVAQGTAIGGTDPTFGKMTLAAYRYGDLIKVGNDSIEDTVFDLEGFLGKNMGRALGRVIGTDLVTGTGTNEPLGIMAASWGSVATGGTLITVDYENLIDMQYSVEEDYLTTGSGGWLMKRATAGALRKLRDGAGGTEGAVLWEPSLTAGIQGGQPDHLLGFPVYTDGNVAAQGSAAKAIWFGDFSAYYVRQVGNPKIERSADFSFNTDETTFRAKHRVDGDVIDTAAGIVSHQRT